MARYRIQAAARPNSNFIQVGMDSNARCATTIAESYFMNHDVYEVRVLDWETGRVINDWDNNQPATWKRSWAVKAAAELQKAA